VSVTHLSLSCSHYDDLLGRVYYRQSHRDALRRGFGRVGNGCNPAVGDSLRMNMG